MSKIFVLEQGMIVPVILVMTILNIFIKYYFLLFYWNNLFVPYLYHPAVAGGCRVVTRGRFLSELLHVQLYEAHEEREYLSHVACQCLIYVFPSLVLL